MQILVELKDLGVLLGSKQLSSSTTVIGRSSSSSLVVPNSYKEISGKHLSIKLDNARIQLLDGVPGRNSTNGVYINGVKVKPGIWHTVSVDDTIVLGDPSKTGSLALLFKRKDLPRPPSINKQKLQRTTYPPTNKPQPQAPVQVSSSSNPLNVAIVRPERTRSRWKTPQNFLVHLLGIIVLVSIKAFQGASGEELALLVAVIIGLEIYFFPSVLSFNRDLPNRYAIAALNLFLGWTLIGWVVSLIWSLTAR